MPLRLCPLGMAAKSCPSVSMLKLFAGLLCSAVMALLSLPSAAESSVQAQHVAGNTWFVQGEAALSSTANRNDISNAGFIVTHYHADHIYGLQVFKDLGATVIAHSEGLDCLNADTAQRRLVASREERFPWIDEKTRLVPADRWLTADTVLELGGERLHIDHVGPVHTPEDLVVYAESAKVLFAGDLVFRGRIPFSGMCRRCWS